MAKQDPAAPDFWVLFQVRQTGDEEFIERFFVLSHEEICRIQDQRSRTYAVKYTATHGKPPDPNGGRGLYAGYPRWTPQNRPFVDGSNPAISGPGSVRDRVKVYLAASC